HCISTPTQAGNVNGGIKHCGWHLAVQFPVDILDFAAALEETFIGFEGRAIGFVLADREIEGALDRFRLSLCVKDPLGALDFYGVQLEVLMSAAFCGRHVVLLVYIIACTQMYHFCTSARIQVLFGDAAHSFANHCYNQCLSHGENSVFDCSTSAPDSTSHPLNHRPLRATRR